MERDGAALPAASGGAAVQGTDGMEELVAGIRLPVGGLSSASDNNTAASPDTSEGQGYGGGEMHMKGDGTKNSVGKINQADEIT
jgi:hypothetical protein